MDAVAEVESWFTRLDCIVIGPGLGRDPLLLDIARQVLLRARAAKLPLVLDGDGLFLVAREPELVEGATPLSHTQSHSVTGTGPHAEEGAKGRGLWLARMPPAHPSSSACTGN